MKAVVKREALVAAVQAATRATSKIDPVLSNVLLQAGLPDLVITGTDRDLVITTRAEAVVHDMGSVLVNGALLGSLASAANTPELVLQVEDGVLSISAGRAHWQFNTAPVTDYPKVNHLPRQDGDGVTAGTFLSAVKRVLPSVSHDNARPILAGMHIEGTETGLRLVATDSYRLSLLDLDFGIPAFQGAVTVPGRALAEVARLKPSELDISANPAKITFTTPDAQITSQLIEGTYVPYRSLLERYSTTTTLVLNRVQVADAIKRVGILADVKNHAVVLDLSSEGIWLKVRGNDLGSASEQLDGEYTGPDTVYAFNAHYLAEGLESAGSDEVEFSLSTNLQPVFLRPVGDMTFMQLLMPVAMA